MIIEKKIINYLMSQSISGILDDVYAEVPVNPPDTYLIVERTGGNGFHVNQGTFAIQTIAPTLEMAMELSNDVVKTMNGFRDAAENVFKCNLNSHHNFTNTQTKEYRYQAVFSITYQED